MAAARGGTQASDAEWVATHRRWATGWRRMVFPAIFLAYLAEVVGGIDRYAHGVAAAAGYVLVAVFCAAYVGAGIALWRPGPTRFPPLFGLAVATTALEVPVARAGAFVMGVFLAVLAVGRWGRRAGPFVVGLTLLAVLLPPAVPSWHAGVQTSLENGTAIAIPLTALAMFGYFQTLRGNRALAEARAEHARLAAENERIRIARDLHDLLGHSLTTIAVKAELAHQLGRLDPDGALGEVGEVAALARRALRDVRAAVASYREVTLAGEIATGRELLRAAGITAELPRAVDVVDEHVQELFGWVLREGLTNVVRHSHARRCVVRVSPRSVEIVDDGVGGGPGPGSGLQGLRERVDAAGGVLEAGPAGGGGWRLGVRLPAVAGRA